MLLACFPFSLWTSWAAQIDHNYKFVVPLAALTCVHMPIYLNIQLCLPQVLGSQSSQVVTTCHPPQQRCCSDKVCICLDVLQVCTAAPPPRTPTPHLPEHPAVPSPSPWALVLPGSDRQPPNPAALTCQATPAPATPQGETPHRCFENVLCIKAWASCKP